MSDTREQEGEERQSGGREAEAAARGEGGTDAEQAGARGEHERGQRDGTRRRRSRSRRMPRPRSARSPAGTAPIDSATEPASRSTAFVSSAAFELGAQHGLGVRLRGGEQLELVTRAPRCGGLAAPWPADARAARCRELRGRRARSAASRAACRCAWACTCAACSRAAATAGPASPRPAPGSRARRRARRRVGGARGDGRHEREAGEGEQRAAEQARLHASRDSCGSRGRATPAGVSRHTSIEIRRMRATGAGVSARAGAVAHQADDQERLAGGEQREQRELPGRRAAALRGHGLAGGHERERRRIGGAEPPARRCPTDRAALDRRDDDRLGDLRRRRRRAPAATAAVRAGGAGGVAGGGRRCRGRVVRLARPAWPGAAAAAGGAAGVDRRSSAASGSA